VYGEDGTGTYGVRALESFWVKLYVQANKQRTNHIQHWLCFWGVLNHHKSHRVNGNIQFKCMHEWSGHGQASWCRHPIADNLKRSVQCRRAISPERTAHAGNLRIHLTESSIRKLKPWILATRRDDAAWASENECFLLASL